MLVEEVPVSPLVAGIGRLKEMVRGVVAKAKGKGKAGPIKDAADAGGKANGVVKGQGKKES